MRFTDQIMEAVQKEENPEQESAEPEPVAPETPEAEAPKVDDGKGVLPGAGDSAEPKVETTPEEKKPEEKVTPPAPKFKVKIEGEEKEIEQEELVRGYQVAQVGHKRIQEGTQAKKDAQFVIDSATKVEKGPDGKEFFNDSIFTQVLSHKLKSPEKAEAVLDEWALKRVGRLLKEEEMSEEQRAQVRRQKELDHRERQVKAQEAKNRSEIQERLNKEADAQLEKDLKTALEKTGLPQSETVLRRIGQYLSWAHENEFQMSAEDAALLVKQERDKLKNEVATEEAAAKKKPIVPKAESTAFPSTESTGERDSPPKDGQRKPRNKTYSSVHEFHRHLEELASR